MPDLSNIVEVALCSDVHGNLQGLELFSKIARARQIQQRICLGDINFRLTAPFTRDSSVTATVFREKLKYDGSEFEAITEGKYSDAQLARLAEPRVSAIAAADGHAEHTYSLIRDIDPDMQVLLGNWDRLEPMQRVLAGQVIEAEFKDVDGLKALATSGGGSAPHGACGVLEGFYSDYPDEDIYRATQARQLLIQPRAATQEENEIDVHFTHIPPTQAGQTRDNYGQHMLNFYMQRNQLGLPLPKLIVHGHHHSGTNVEWQNYKDLASGEELKVLTLNPGTLATQHNTATYSTFAIAQFDKDTKRLVRVEEYHVKNSMAGIVNVVLHGEHIIDHETQEIEFNLLNETVMSEANKELFKESLTLDNNYSLLERGIITDYDGLTPEEADLRLRQNLSVIERYVKEAADTVKGVVSAVRNGWLNSALASGKELSDKFEARELAEQQRKIADILGEKAAKEWNIDLSEIDFGSEFDRLFYTRRLMEASFGITMDDLVEELTFSELTYESIPANWGGGNQRDRPGITQRVSKALNGQYQHHAIKNISDETWVDMVEKVYMPLNVKRKRDLTKNEAIQLYSKGFNQGLLTEADATAKGLYEVTEDFDPNEKTRAEIYEKFGIGYDDLQPRENRATLSTLESEQLQERINQGTSVFRNTQGDYVLTEQGPLYINPEANLQYEPTSIRELLDDNRAQLIAQGDQYLLNIGQGHDNLTIPVNPDLEGFDPENYQAMPLWQVQQQQRVMERLQRQFQQQQYGDAQRGIDPSGSVDNLEPQVPLDINPPTF